jgi:hypothetical protein
MTDTQQAALRLIAWDRNMSEAERKRILAEAFRPADDYAKTLELVAREMAS